MGWYKDTYISIDEFHSKVIAGELYEGYVVGMGYAYTETYHVIPSIVNGCAYDWSAGDGIRAYTHPILVTDQCIDYSPGAVMKSFRLTSTDIYDAIVHVDARGTTVNMGSGNDFFIPAGANHKIGVEIIDGDYDSLVRVKVENIDAGIIRQTETLLSDFPFFFEVFPDVPQEFDEPGRGVGQPGFWESMIPIWGSARSAVDHFQKGNIWRGVLYSVLAVSDVFLVKSIATGLAKGAFKIAGSHSWSASRRWMAKRGYANPGEQLHHWAIPQATAKRHGIEAVANQPWNMVRFQNHSIHMRAGHGFRYMNEPAMGALQRFWYGTPTWFKAAGTSTVGRGVLMPLDGIYTDYEQTLAPIRYEIPEQP